MTGALPAWVLSIGIHAGLLYGFSVMAIEPAGVQEGQAPARISVEQIEQMLRTEPVTSKPAVERAALKPAAPVEAAAEPTAAALPDAFEFPEETLKTTLDFFGQKTEARRIAFVVDCSGSMFGQMGIVKQQLRQSIHALRPDQFFSVVFFSGDGRIQESGDGALRRATAGQKQTALELVAGVVPGGQTQALPALRRALELREPGGRRVEVIYFLTDGFDLEATSAASFVQQAAGYRRSLAPAAMIHTIGFWTEEGDQRILESLAALSGGQFTIVE